MLGQRWIVVCTSSYCLLTLLAYQRMHDPEALQMLRGQVPNTVYDRSTCMFLAALALDLLHIPFEHQSTRMDFVLLPAFMKAMSTTTNLTVRFFTPVVALSTAGRAVVLQRYICWFHSTATILALLKLISTTISNQEMAHAIFWDQVMLATGALAPLTTGWLQAALAVITHVTLLPILPYMAKSFKEAIASCNTRSMQHTMYGSFVLVLALWVCFAVVWDLAIFNLISPTLEESLYLTCDFGAKVLFSSTLMLSGFKGRDARQQTAMRHIEGSSKQHLINELQQLVAQKERFMSSVSHELRTPLTAIIRICEGLLVGRAGILPEAVRRQLYTIRTAGARLLTLVNGVMEATALRQNTLALKQEQVVLRHLVDDVLDLTRGLAHPEVELRNTVPHHIRVLGDQGRIVQALNNLLSNAAKFTQRGVIRVSARAFAGNSKVALTVSDTGVGIPRDSMATIFQPFEQVMSNRGGVGLGLSLVQEIAKAHGGEIWAESVEGRGSVFTLTLPSASQHSPGVNNQGAGTGVSASPDPADAGSAAVGAATASGRAGARAEASNRAMGDGRGGGSLRSRLLQRQQQERIGADAGQGAASASSSRRPTHDSTAFMDNSNSGTPAGSGNHGGVTTSSSNHGTRSASYGTYTASSSRGTASVRGIGTGNSKSASPGGGSRLGGMHVCGQGRGMQQGGSTMRVPTSDAGTSSGSSCDNSYDAAELSALASSKAFELEPEPAAASAAATSTACTTTTSTAGSSMAPFRLSPTTAHSKGAGDSGSGEGSGGANLGRSTSVGNDFINDGGGRNSGRSVRFDLEAATMVSRAEPATVSNAQSSAAFDSQVAGTAPAVPPPAELSAAFGSVVDAPLPSDMAGAEPAPAASCVSDSAAVAVATSSTARRLSPLAPRDVNPRGMAPKNHSPVVMAAEPSSSLQLRPSGHVEPAADGLAAANAPHADPRSPSAFSPPGAALTAASPVNELSMASQQPTSTVKDSQAADADPHVHPPSPAAADNSQGVLLLEQRPFYSAVHGMQQIISVDADAVSQNVLRVLLRSAGYQVLSFGSGTEALDHLAMCAALPDCVLLDCVLPDMDGFQVLRRLREALPHLHLPVILVSPQHNELNIVRGLDSGADDVVSKPYRRLELLARVQGQLGPTSMPGQQEGSNYAAEGYRESEHSATSTNTPGQPVSQTISVEGPGLHVDKEPPEQQHSVLCIDDDDVSQTIVEGMLRSQGYRYLRSPSAEHGLAFLLTCSEPPDLVLLNCMLPDCSGLGACRRIREMYSKAQLPIILLSTRSNEQSVVESVEQGDVNDYLSTPVRKGELVARIRMHIRLAYSCRSNGVAGSPPAGMPRIQGASSQPHTLAVHQGQPAGASAQQTGQQQMSAAAQPLVAADVQGAPMGLMPPTAVLPTDLPQSNGSGGSSSSGRAGAPRAMLDASAALAAAPAARTGAVTSTPQQDPLACDPWGSGHSDHDSVRRSDSLDCAPEKGRAIPSLEAMLAAAESCSEDPSWLTQEELVQAAQARLAAAPPFVPPAEPAAAGTVAADGTADVVAGTAAEEIVRLATAAEARTAVEPADLGGHGVGMEACGVLQQQLQQQLRQVSGHQAGWLFPSTVHGADPRASSAAADASAIQDRPGTSRLEDAQRLRQRALTSGTTPLSALGEMGVVVGASPRASALHHGRAAGGFMQDPPSGDRLLLGTSRSASWRSLSTMARASNETARCGGTGTARASTEGTARHSNETYHGAERAGLLVLGSNAQSHETAARGSTSTRPSAEATLTGVQGTARPSTESNRLGAGSVRPSLETTRSGVGLGRPAFLAENIVEEPESSSLMAGLRALHMVPEAVRRFSESAPAALGPAPAAGSSTTTGSSGVAVGDGGSRAGGASSSNGDLLRSWPTSRQDGLALARQGRQSDMDQGSGSVVPLGSAGAGSSSSGGRSGSKKTSSLRRFLTSLGPKNRKDKLR